MATTTIITSIATKYGTKSYGTLGSVYVGAGYRTRITFPAVRGNAAIGDANIVISKVLLHMRRNDGGATNIVAGCSTNSAWGAAVDASAGGTIPASTGWHTIDITACAQHLLEYGGNWHLHIWGNSTRVRCNGAGSGSDPYISIVWEYAASTITTGTEKSALGQPINFAITKQSGEAKYALSYSFGNESGNIGETTGSSITWTPPLTFATEIPNAESGEMRVTMRVYDASGKQLRSEVLFVTVTVPESAQVKFQNNAFTVSTVNGLVYGNASAALTGKSSFRITPVLDITNAYGASIASLKAQIDNGGSIQTIEWASLTETDAGIFKGNALETAVQQKSGTAKITLTATDTRGREVTSVRTFNVYAYANPAISEFSVERYEPVYDANEQISGYAPSDVGENVWVTLSASCTNVIAGGASRNFLAWKITAKASDGTETVYSGSADQSVNIVNDRAVITAVIPAANAVEYTAEVSDTAGYKANQYDSVAAGRANFALAGSKFGASFGCMPKGTEYRPMLESAYPIYAYAGIDGVTNYVEGEVNTGGRWIDGRPIYRNVVRVSFTATNTNITVTTINDLRRVLDIRSYLCDNNSDNPSGGGQYPNVFFYSTSNYITTFFSAKDLIVRSSRAAHGYLIVYYTKTTDAESHQAFATVDGNNLVTADGYNYMTKNTEV